MNTVVIRFSSLGDIVLTGAVTQALAPVTYVTHPRYRALAAALPGVASVVGYGEDPLPSHARAVIDLHASWRSRLVARRIRGPVRSVRRHDIRRRLRVHLKAGAAPPAVVERYARAAQVPAAPQPWLPVASGDRLILCPTAAHATKAWPLERYAALGRQWDGPVTVLGGPDDAASVRAVVDGIGSRAEGVWERGFTRTLAAIRAGGIAVGGDTGLMHLCAASGLPTVVLFGPTTRDDGFWPHPSASAAVSLACRPCSRHGGPRCPFGDHKCMSDLSVDAVWSRLSEVRP